MRPHSSPRTFAVKFKLIQFLGDGLGLSVDYTFAPVAQLDRASAFEAEGREFESLRARHSIFHLSASHVCQTLSSERLPSTQAARRSGTFLLEGGFFLCTLCGVAFSCWG